MGHGLGIVLRVGAGLGLGLRLELRLVLGLGSLPACTKSSLGRACEQVCALLFQL